MNGQGKLFQRAEGFEGDCGSQQEGRAESVIIGFGYWESLLHCMLHPVPVPHCYRESGTPGISNIVFDEAVLGKLLAVQGNLDCRNSATHWSSCCCNAVQKMHTLLCLRSVV